MGNTIEIIVIHRIVDNTPNKEKTIIRGRRQYNNNDLSTNETKGKGSHLKFNPLKKLKHLTKMQI